MKIREAMSSELRSVGPTQAIADAARTMAEADIGVLPVLEEGRLIGIVTDRDLAVRGLAQGLHAGSPVLRVMTADVETCRPDDEVEMVLGTMAEQQVRRMPVCAEDGKVVGLFSIGDAARLDPDKDDVGEALADICQPHGQHCQNVAA